MKTIINITFLFFHIIIGLAQVSIQPLTYNQSQRYNIPSNARINSTQIIDTLELPFIDDFSTSVISPDTLLWENKGGVYINNHYSNNAPTINTASFDGIKENGSPYVFPTNSSSSLSITGNTDYLTSKPINLEGIDSTNNLAFSFFWQMGGNHIDVFPNLAKGNALNLYFYDVDSNWIQVWPITNSDSTSIKNFTSGDDYILKFIPIKETKYLHAGFKFKFQSHGVLTGNWSMWQVDYIYLDTNRVDNNIQDFAFSGQVTSLLKGYSAVPYNQYKNNPDKFLNDSIYARYSNLTNNPNFRDKRHLTINDLTNEIINDTTISSVQLPNNSSTTFSNIIDKNKIKDYILSKNEDNINLDYTFQITGTDQIELIKANDAVINSNHISDYFAYDDGTAEAALAVAFGGYGQAAYEFELDVQDTLTAIYIQWSRAGQDISGISINLKVWETIEGINGATEDKELLKKLTTIQYSDELNGFTRIDFNQQIILKPGKFYIGWEQYSPEKEIKVALDMSVNNMDKFYQYINSNWSQPNPLLANGSPLIRPKFGFGNSSGMGPVGLEKSLTRKGINNLEIYPNPANNQVIIEGRFTSVKIYNLTGGIIWETAFTEDQNKHEINTTDFPEGLYIIEASNEDKSYSKRLTITH